MTTNSYDAEGRLLQAEQSAGGTMLRTTSSTWTPTGKLASATDANGNTTRYAYDLLERQVTLTDAMGRVTEFTYDAVSRPLKTYNRAIKPATAMLEQTWTDDGKLASVIDANNNTTTYHYDQFNRLDLTTWPGGSTETATYDQADNVVQRTSRANGTFNLLYDTLYRVIRKTPPSGPVVDYGSTGRSCTRLTYDASVNLWGERHQERDPRRPQAGTVGCPELASAPIGRHRVACLDHR